MSNLKEIAKSGLLLAGFALLGTFALATAYQLTKPQIEANERAATLSRLNALVSPDSYDNDLLSDKVELPASAFNSAETVTAYRARKQGTPIAALFMVTAPDGYSGKIHMVVGIKADQTLAGVRVLEHKETPGLGDRIETEKSDWILGFTSKSLHNPNVAGWAVRKDGGQFDQFTGATITPRAVVKEIKATLLWSQQNLATLFGIPAGTYQAQEQK
jgi:electron transport complex protein RnfG